MGDQPDAAEAIARHKRNERRREARRKKRLADEKKAALKQKADAYASRALAEAKALESREAQRVETGRRAEEATRRADEATKAQRVMLRAYLDEMRGSTDPLVMLNVVSKMILRSAESAVEDETLSGKEVRNELRLIHRSATAAMPAERLLQAEEMIKKTSDVMHRPQREVVQKPRGPEDGSPMQMKPRRAR